MENKTFPCSGCGACCRRIKQVIESVEGLDFPYKWNDKGWCEMLSPDNKCLVYDNRPLICNIDKALPLFDMPKQEFYDLNIAVCNSLMDEDVSPQEYRILKQ